MLYGEVVVGTDELLSVAGRGGTVGGSDTAVGGGRDEDIGCADAAVDDEDDSGEATLRSQGFGGDDIVVEDSETHSHAVRDIM